MSKAKDFKFDR